jgi:putative membrane protein
MVKTIIFLILVALIVLFVLQNTQVVEARFLLWKVSMSRSLLLLGTFLIGIIAGWLLRRPRHKG